MTDDLRDRLKAMNPEPFGDPSPDELAAVFAVIETRRSTMTLNEAHDTTTTEVPVGVRRRPVVAFAGMALLMILGVGGVALLFGGGGGPMADSTLAPAASTTVAEETTSTSLLESSTDSAREGIFSPPSWERVGAGVMDPVVNVTGITYSGEELIAVAYVPGEDGEQDGVVFTSEDGATWTRMAQYDPALTEGWMIMTGVVSHDGGITAVGYGCDNEEDLSCVSATAWTSPDGTTWTRTGFDADVFGDRVNDRTSMGDVISTAHGLVAVGELTHWTFDEVGVEQMATTHPAIWTSPDGLTWERPFLGEGIDLEPSEHPDAKVWINAVAEGAGGRLVAVGPIQDDDGTPIAGVWTSDDAQTWTRVPHDPSVFSDSDDQPVYVWDVAAGERGFMAVGGEGRPARPVVWTSPDGLSWTRAPIEQDDFDFVGSLGSVAVGSDGYVAAGPAGSWSPDNPQLLTAWTSTDGASWRPIAELRERGFVWDILGVDEAVVLGGSFEGTSGVHAGVWIGPASTSP
jgi:hypothetical protein